MSLLRAQLETRMVAQMATQMISLVAIPFTSKGMGTKAVFLFKVTHLIKTFWNVGEMNSSAGYHNVDSTSIVILE